MKKILIIEDDQGIGDTLAGKLRLEGYETILVKDGAEGLGAILAQKPDLVFLGLVIPSMNGYELLETKRKDLSVAQIPVIVIADSGQPVEVDRAIALGAKDYIVKTEIDTSAVVTKIKKCFGDEAGIEPSPLNGRTILWVEDDKFIADLLTAKFASTGCFFLHAENAERAIEILKARKPDIILADIILPGTNGFDLLKRIKDEGLAPGVPIVVLSNLSQQSDRDKASELGAVKFLVKAEHNPAEIIDEIVSILGAAK